MVILFLFTNAFFLRCPFHLNHERRISHTEYLQIKPTAKNPRNCYTIQTRFKNAEKIANIFEQRIIPNTQLGKTNASILFQNIQALARVAT